MSEYADGTVYGKYIKIKSGPQGVKHCCDYIRDPAKSRISFDESQEEIPYAQSALRYITSDPKVISPSSRRRLVSGHNCHPYMAAREFSLVEKLYHTYKDEHLAPGQKANQAFHIILSYKGTSTSPDTVHLLGCEFPRRLCGDEFQAVTATHLNTGNYHSHILVNAYALDGRHKFRDSYHVYRQFRDLANEISLEYGLPIFVNDGKKKPYQSWKEFTATQEGISWKQAITRDLENAIAAASSYEEVLQIMEQKGYEIQYNPRSITFKKDGGRVRDSRLGHPYTRDGITAALEQKARDTGKQAQTDEASGIRQDPEDSTSNPAVYISRYDQYGRRRSFLMRILLMMKESFRQTLDQDCRKSPDHQSPWITDYAAKMLLKRLEEAVLTADRYNITDPDVLDMELRELHAKKASCRRNILCLEDYLEHAGEIRQLIAEYRRLEPSIRAAGICPSELVSTPDASAIQENLAKLNPATPRTCSRLYQALHNSPYILRRKFRTLTETEAYEILKAIRENRMEDLPDGLVLRNSRVSSATDQDHLPQDTASPSRKKPSILLKKYSPDTRQVVLDFKALADQLASYGLTDPDTMEQFLKDLESRLLELDAQKSVSKEILSEIRSLFRLKRSLDQFDTAVLTPGNRAFRTAFLNSSQANGEKNGHSRYDILSYLNTRLDSLPSIRPAELEVMRIPDPEEYRFLHDLQTVFPDADTLRADTPERVHHLIAKLKSEQFLQKEMIKELEKERKNAHHDQNNAL